MSKRFLVTGATGFIGAHLVRRLTSLGKEVHILTRPESNRWRIADVLKEVHEHDADITDRISVEEIIARIKPQIVYHCATYGACPGQHDVIRSGKVNVMGTIHLVEALVKVGGYECMVNTGSSAEYGKKSKPMSELDPLAPNTAYGATKAGAALFCEAIACSKKQPILNLKLTSPFGPYDEGTRLIPAVIRKCLAGQDPELSTGIESRSFFFIDDLMDLYLKIPQVSWAPGETVIAGPEQQYSVRDIATRIIRLTGNRVKPRFGVFPPREFDTDFWVADIRKVKKMFSWHPTTDIDEGLTRTIEWHKNFDWERYGRVSKITVRKG